MALFCLTGCTSSEDELRMIELSKGQSKNVEMYADDFFGEVLFTAQAHWSSWVSTVKNGTPESVEWLTLDGDHPYGEAGDALIMFNLSENNTGASRTAYIIIVCEDSKLSIKVTQLPDESGDDDDDIPVVDLSGFVEIVCGNYYGMDGQFYDDGEMVYSFYYSAGRACEMRCHWRDDIANGPGASPDSDSYCETTEKFRFEWGDNTVNVESQVFSVYYPSGKRENFIDSRHSASLVDGRGVSGSYVWVSDGGDSHWSADYNSDGFLSHVDHYELSGAAEGATLTWEDGCLKRIDCSDGSYVTISYADGNLVNYHTQFDVNWVIPTELACYDLAAGDKTKILSSCGLMGKPSRLLMTEITEYSANGTKASYKISYSENSKELVKARAVYTENGLEKSCKDWEFRFSNIQ